MLIFACPWHGVRASLVFSLLQVPFALIRLCRFADSCICLISTRVSFHDPNIISCSFSEDINEGIEEDIDEDFNEDIDLILTGHRCLPHASAPECHALRSIAACAAQAMNVVMPNAGALLNCWVCCE
jgi:hypothetical protein